MPSMTFSAVKMKTVILILFYPVISNNWNTIPPCIAVESLIPSKIPKLYTRTASPSDVGIK